MGPFAAALMNRFGLRPIILLLQGLVALGLFGAMWMTELWQLTLLGVMVGFGTGLTAMGLGTAMVSQWFSQRRGLSLVLLPFSDFSLYALSIFAIFCGLDWVATVPPTVKLTAETFGERSNAVF